MPSKSRSPSPDVRSRRDDSEDDRRERRRRERSDSRERRRRSRSRSGDRDRRRRDDDSRAKRRERSRSRSRSPKRSRRAASPVKEATPPPVEKKKEDPADILRTRAGGAYIPPAKLKLMQEQMNDKSSEQYQRVNWERIKKRIHGEVNKVNVGNLVGVVRSLLQENIVRGKGILCRSIMQAQAFSPGFSHVYAALVAVINSKFPFIGELLVRRLVIQFKRCFRRGDKATTVIVTKFIAHLINQHVTHEILGLEISLLMLDKPTDDSVEVAITFIKECGAKLSEVAPRALASVFERLRAILNDTSDIDKRTQYMIESAMAILKDKFQAYPAVVDDLDLIDEEDQITHMVTLEEAQDPENGLNVFKLDTEFEKTEAEYDEVRREVIGDADDSDDEAASEEDDADDGEDPTAPAKETLAAKADKLEIIDNTEQALVAFRREVYLTIQSSLDFQEAAHKLLKMGIKPQLEPELCHMLVDCCAQQRTYERFYGMLIERFCRLKEEFQRTFEQIIRDTYKTIHRFDITKLRNAARLAAHLLQTDAIEWIVLEEVKLNERDSTSSGRIWLKEVFQELSREMGMVKLWERTKDKTLKRAFAGIFPRDNPEDTRFSINFFTAIGLGALTLDMREWLEKGMKKRQEEKEESSSSDSDSDSDSDSSDSSDSDSDSSSSSSSSSSSDSDDDKKKKKKKKTAEQVKKEADAEPARPSATATRREERSEREHRPPPPPVKEVKREPETDDEHRKRDDRDRRGGRDERDRDDGRRRDDRDDRRRGDRGDERRERDRRDRSGDRGEKRRDDDGDRERDSRRERSVERERRERRRRSRS